MDKINTSKIKPSKRQKGMNLPYQNARIKKDNLSKWCPQYNEYHPEWKNYYLEDVDIHQHWYYKEIHPLHYYSPTLPEFKKKTIYILSTILSIPYIHTPGIY